LDSASLVLEIGTTCSAQTMEARMDKITTRVKPIRTEESGITASNVFVSPDATDPVGANSTTSKMGKLLLFIVLELVLRLVNQLPAWPQNVTGLRE
jgi:hypothetical protein